MYCYNVHVHVIQISAATMHMLTLSEGIECSRKIKELENVERRKKKKRECPIHIMMMGKEINYGGAP